MQKLFQNKNLTQKIIIALVIVILFNFICPLKVQAAGYNFIFQGASWIVVKLTDCVQWIISFCLTGDKTAVTTRAIWDGDPENKENWMFQWFTWNGLGKFSIEWPKRHLVTPADIFTGKILITNINFFSDYNEIEDGISSNEDALLNDSTADSMNKLRTSIAKWYLIIRNITVVGLLSVLVYIAIEMVISSASQDKAKYQKMLMDWLVAICLVFLLHYIMAATIGICTKITELLNSEIVDEYYLDSGDQFIYTNKDGEKITYGSEESGEEPVQGLADKIRIYTSSNDSATAMSYALMYFAITGYTVIFLWIYMKRFVYMAFFTLVAPIVALTYPIDKVRDGSAQAFDSWIKEYIYNALLQPFNLLIYTVFIGLAYDLASSNFIYTAVVLGTIRIADEQLGNWMGMNKAGTRKGIADAATGILAFNGLKSIMSGGESEASSSASSSGGSSSTTPNIRTKDNSFLNSGGNSNLQGVNVPQGGSASSSPIRTANQGATQANEGTSSSTAASTGNTNSTNTNTTTTGNSQENSSNKKINRNLANSKYVKQGKKRAEFDTRKVGKTAVSSLKSGAKTIASGTGKLVGAGLGALMAASLGQSAVQGAIGGATVGNTLVSKVEKTAKGIAQGYEETFQTDERKQMKKLSGNYELKHFYGEKEEQYIAASLAADMKLDIQDDKKAIKSVMDVANEIVAKYDGIDYDDALELSRDMWMDRNNTPVEERSSYKESLRTRFGSQRGQIAADVFDAHGKFGENKLGQVYQLRQMNNTNNGV